MLSVFFLGFLSLPSIHNFVNNKMLWFLSHLAKVINPIKWWTRCFIYLIFTNSDFYSYNFIVSDIYYILAFQTSILFLAIQWCSCQQLNWTSRQTTIKWQPLLTEIVTIIHIATRTTAIKATLNSKFYMFLILIVLNSLFLHSYLKVGFGQVLI